MMMDTSLFLFLIIIFFFFVRFTIRYLSLTSYLHTTPRYTLLLYYRLSIPPVTTTMLFLLNTGERQRSHGTIPYFLYVFCICIIIIVLYKSDHVNIFCLSIVCSARSRYLIP